ncbi:MAG: hypothetical protein MRZ79_00005 [Bacteroidia bacterium]|nr:hypothetical protein [Bacteroidia bacterium]
MTDFISDKILFYPTIEFYDSSWLKSALTIWDTVYRIVPDSYSPNDSDEVKTAIEAGLLKTINLGKNDLEKAAEKFEDFCDNLDFSPAGLDGYNNVKLHVDKIDSRIRPLLESLSKKIDSSGWLSVSEPVAHAYMIHLSNSICDRRGIPKFTDNDDMFNIMSYFQSGGNVDEYVFAKEDNEAQTNLLISHLTPADIRSISMDRIVRLNEKFSKSKADYRDSISDFSEKLSTCEDEGFMAEQVSEFQKSLEETQHTRYEILKSFCKDIVSHFLITGIPTSGIVAARGGFSGSTIENLFTGFAIAGIASLAPAAKDLRDNWNANKNNYYIEMRKDLSSEDSFRSDSYRHTRIMEEFIND